MLWAYGDYKYFNSASVGPSLYVIQILTYKDGPRAERPSIQAPRDHGKLGCVYAETITAMSVLIENQ